ncbi:YSIRK-type signal peptide-containing protein [Streptococcus parasanguinis]|uniref:CshA/CshB family fibrillar adhesin-related protein n=1 Tax=Streptococcus parasanguinis TaxID=1318 RepID=UPI001914767A|nr:CshA/CshB family fibrillar adhesin-related protein [Streptococcus parasanguinis]MBK5126152.1 YSIRK-type signal peptide-containing protein [Streptococcus parasanguinis]
MGKDLFNDRISRFSIRKLNVGVCSVLLGTLVMVGTAASAAAEEKTDTTSENVAAVTAASEAPEASTATATSATSTAATTSTYDANAAITAPETSTAAATSTAPASTSEASSTSTAASVASTAAATSTAPSLEVTTPENKATEAAATDKKEEVAAGAEAPATETPAVTAETSGPKRRNRRALGDANDPSLIGDDVEDATSTPKVEKPGFTTDLDAKSMTSQISWLDFGDLANWTGAKTIQVAKNELKPNELEEALALQVGATYTKEIMPGYVVTVKVKSLKPFQATEIYKKRLEEQGATEAEKASYDPNAKNGYVKGVTSPIAKQYFTDGKEADVIADAQNRWTEVKHENVDTKAKKTTMGSAYNGGNIGVQFEISATFRGKKVKPAIVMADGESANPGEFVMFTTNGQGWQHLGEWKKTTRPATSVPYEPQDTDNLFGSKPKYNNINLRQLRDNSTQAGPDKKPVAWKYFGNPDKVTGGLGTGIFGPNISEGNRAVPLVMTRGASEVGLYIASAGKQSAMLGFFPLDEGDAPESYGKAVHTIATVDGVTGAKVNQPYLGNVSPDMDENTTLDWFGDDKATTADEGINQLLPDELKGTTNEMIKMDRTRPGNYKMSVQAHLDGASEAHIYGWVDFNQNGKFDEDERSNLATITQDGTVELTFANSKTYIDPSVNELGARVRIAKKATEIESPTGMAFSGEVEDFKTQITHPPKGEFKETSGPQATKQTATVTFTARGEHKYEPNSHAVIDETVEPYIVDKDGNRATLDADGYYVVPGQGKYKITANGKDVDVEFIPEDNFLGTADGISIRRSDNNGYDTGWSTKFPDQEPNINGQLNTMDGQYVPTVTPIEIEGVDKTSTDVQGATQKETPTFNTTATNLNGDKISITPSAEYPAKLVDPATGRTTDEPSVTVEGEGTYTINPTTGEVTFTPEPSFTGTAKGVDVTLSAPVGRNKNGKVQEEYVKTATAKYTPTVTPITVTPTDKVSEDVQNVPQTQTPTFDLSNDKTAEITSKKLVDPATGQPTDETTVTVAGEGSYTIDPTTGAVTFTPEKDFVGTAKGVTVQATATITNANGKTATITSDATYTPTVVPAVPTANPATSKDIQGATQTGTPTFAGTTVQVNGEDKAITIKDNSYTLLDKDGNEVSTTPAYAADGTTVIGNFTIDPANGQVTFTPTDKSYTGAVTPAKVQAESSNGIKVDTTYTPEIVPVTPTATSAETKDVQGATQTGKPEFKGGTVTVDGVEKTVEINEDVPAKFDDGSTTKTVEGVGTYTVASDGTVTFVPEKSFVGTAPAVTVVREDKNGSKASATYTPTVLPVTPTATPAETTDIQGATQKGKPEFKGGTVTVDGVEKTVEINEDVPATFDDGSTTKTVEGVGTYTVAADGTVTFVPEKSFTGKAPAVTVVREDKNGTKASATYTPTVTPVTPTATPAETTDIQGATQTGKPVFTEGDSRVPMNDDVPATFDDGSTTKTVDGVGTYTVAADGTVTFVPEKSFTGKAPAVTVVREDKNGTKASATYTPTVTPVTPTATPVETTGKQGQTQTGKPVFTEGNSRVPMNDDVPATFDDGSTTKTVDGVGTYTVAADGTVTFVPEKSFTGKAPAVTVVREDKNGTKASATYTPTVTPVTPTATPAESTGPQGLVQTGTVTFTEGDEVAPINKDSITLLDENGQPAASVVAKSPEGKEIGTFTVDKDTGVVTFTPTDKSYSGDVVPVKVQAADTNGTTVETTYTPKITPVVPTSEDATSTDIQGQTQSGKPTFTEGNPNVPIDEDTPATFEDGSTTKTVDGEGTYTVSPDGTVTFVPEKSFTGTASGVTVKRVDKNGTEITAKYTPTVTPVTPTATPAESTDIQGATQTGKPKFTEGDSRVPMNDDVPATFDDGSTTKTVDGVGTYTVAADGTVTFVPEKSFVGTAPAVTVVREDKNGTKASATYTPTVTPVTPTAEDTTSTDKQGQTQTGTPTFTPGNPNVPMDDDTPATFEDGSTTKTIPGEGTYTVAPDGTVTFVPEKSFTGEGTGVTVKRVDKNGTPVTAKYTPTVTPVTPTASPAESEAPQGVVQTGTVNFTEGDPVAPIDKDTITLLDENGQPAESVVAKSPEGKEIGTFTVDKETGVVTFTPTDKSYSGDVVPVKVQGKDTNGTVAETTYTPKITPVVPTADPATSTDIQGKTQTGTPSFTPGNPAIPMDDDVPATFEDGSTTKVIPGEGTYTVAPDGTVTFVPEKSFTGTGTGVTVKRVDKNGTPVTATYTPTVTPVTPTAKPTTSTDIQGATQTGKPEFTEGDSRVPMNDDVPATFDDGSTTKTVEGVGTYTVAPDGTVTFVPEKSFVGTAPAVTVVREDKNGTKASATYTPTVTPVTPTASPAVSTDVQGATQTGKPVFTEGDSRVPMNDDVPATFDDGSTTKTVEGVGTYTVAPDGTVTFVPEKSFVGTAPAVTVVREDKNGTKASATYTPTVTPVTPTADPATSTDIQGQTQTGKPSFTPGNPSVPMDDDVPATFEDGSTTKTIPGEGTYTVAPDGTVTFVPEKSFTGTGTGVTVKRVDKNGTPITATYTPTVTPVTPTAEPATSIGKKGATQTGKPTFTEGDSRVPMNDGVPATFEDGSTTKTIPGVGTYTVAADGTVTFTPEPEFTGTAPAVTVVREDVNGTKASATYTPTVLPITKYVDKEGKEIPGYPAVDGEEPKAEIPGYRFVETKKLPNGDTEHVYEKVTTSYVDENGDPIPGNPTEDGEQPKKDIPGYDFVKTVVDKDGNTQHIYKKTVTPTPMPDPTPTPEPQPQPIPQPQPTPEPQPTPQPKPEEPTIPVVPETKEEVKYIDPQNPTAQLPNTGTKESSTAGLAIFSALAGLSLFGFAKRKKED